MKLSGAIMAHPSRALLVEDLLSALDRSVPVCWDPNPVPSGSGDRVWSVAREAWRVHDPDADWHVLIQDDALVCADFMAGMERALHHVPPRSVVCPYLGMGRNVPRRWGMLADKASARGASWAVSHRVMWGVCLALPTDAISDMVSYADRKAGMPDDMRVSGWATRYGWDAWYTWPSLVDHLPVQSLTKHRASDRVARLHHRGSALDLDWSGGVVVDPMLTRARGPRSAPVGAWKGR